MPPKSAKLQREEMERTKSPNANQNLENNAPSVTFENNGPVKIRRINCCNDFVAILQAQVQSNIELAGSSAKFKNEGLVVGVGPGVADGAGGRLKPCVEVGDYVMFGEKNVIQKLESDSPPYKGHIVVILSERNVICKLPKQIDWTDYEAE